MPSKAPRAAAARKPPSLPPPQNDSRLSRNANERLLKIHLQIGAQKFPNTASLARDLEVSQRTLKRDIEWMKVHWHAPIEFNPSRNGYFYSEPVDKFPGVPTVTEAEMFALLVAHKGIEQYQATPFHKPLQMAFQKLTAQLNNRERYSLQDFETVLSFRPFAPAVIDLERFQAVTRALQHRRSLRFHYRKPGQKRPEFRHVEPYHLTCNDNLWYLFAWEDARSDFRTFCLSRICGNVFVAEKFQKSRDFNLAKYLASSFTMLKGEGDFDIVIEFDAWATDMIRNRVWHASQQLTELPGGGSHLRLRLGALEEVERWVLSWGTHATVIKPEALAERVGSIARQLSKRYPE